MKLLHLDSGILGDHSVTRRLSAALVDRIRRETPEAEIVHRDLVARPLAHLTGAHLAAAATPANDEAAVDPAVAADVAESRAALQEFIDADVIVIGAPMYNFTVPTQLKAWIDRIAVAGKTFRYTEKGPVGLMGGKRVIVASSRGGFYGAGTPLAAIDHQETYLQAVFAFLGIDDVTFVRAEGVGIGAEQKRTAIETAEREIGALTFVNANARLRAAVAMSPALREVAVA